MRYLVLLLTLLFAALAGCGSSGWQPAEAPVMDDSFELIVQPETFDLGGSAQFQLQPKASPDVVAVEIVARDASALKAAYIEVAYDARALTPLSIISTDAIAPKGARLELASISTPGRLYLGQVAIDPPRAGGLNGTGVVGRVEFARRSFASVRGVSDAPVSLQSAAQLTYSSASKSLSWGYAHQGDYDQNSLTTISDLTPLATRIGMQGPFNYNSADAVVNGDGNAEINIADITPIGVNFGRRIEAFNVYGSPSATAVPQQPGAVSTLAPLASVAYEEHTGNSAAERLRFSYVLSAPQPGWHYWVRPADGQHEGTPSNAVQVPNLPGNAAPVITGLVATPDSVSSGGTASVDALAVDTNGDSLTYEWSASSGAITGTGANVLWNAPLVDAQTTATVSLTVNDGKGGSDSASVEIEVVPTINQPPVINSVIADPGSIDPNGSVAVTVDAVDPDGDALEYNYSATAGAVIGTSSTAVFIAPATPGVVTVSVVVDDGQGHSASANVDIRVIDPGLQLDEVEDNDNTGQAQQPGTLAFTVNGNVGAAGDNDGDSVDYFKLDAVAGDLLDITLTYDPAAWLEFAVFNGHDLYDVGIGNAGALNLKIGFRSTDPGPYYVVVQSINGSSDYELSCAPILDFAEVEDNDALAQATPLPPLGEVQWTMFNGSLGLPGYDGDTVDYLSFTLATGDEPHFDVMYDPAVGTLTAELYDATGKLLSTGNDFGDLISVDYNIGSTDVAPFALKLSTSSPRAAYWITGYMLQH